MERVNSVSDVTRKSVSQSTDQIDDVRRATEAEKAEFFDRAGEFSDRLAVKENPAVAAAGLTDNSDQAELTMTGEAFSDAFRRMIQAFDTIQDIVGTWCLYEKGRSIYNIEDPERCVMVLKIRDATEIYKQCYQGSITCEFPTFFNCTYEEFERALLRLKQIYGGAE